MSTRRGAQLVPIGTLDCLLEERRELIQYEVRSMDEERRQVKSVTMKKQGAWVNWEGVRNGRLSLSEIMSMQY